MRERRTNITKGYYRTFDGFEYGDAETAFKTERNLHSITDRGYKEAISVIEAVASVAEGLRSRESLSGEDVFRMIYPLVWEHMPDGWGEEKWMREARGEG